MQRTTLHLGDIAATEGFGKVLAEHLPDGCVVSLSGTLGAGKTRLVQCVAAACGIDSSEVVSPTFVLCREYHGRRHLFHMDVYRLKHEDEFLELGPEEMFSSDALIFIEWAEKVASFLPEERLEISLEVTSEFSRQVEIVAEGERFGALMAKLALLD